MTCTRLTNSEIPGSKVVCTSPRLIAAYHVLHRLLVPRHPPYALCSLTKNLPVTFPAYKSERPKYIRQNITKWIYIRLSKNFNLIMVGLGGVEPPTSRLSGVRSNQLSYRPRAMSLTMLRYCSIFQITCIEYVYKKLT